MVQCTRGALKEEVKWKVSNAKGTATNLLRNNQGMRNVAIIMWELLQQRGSTGVRMQRGDIFRSSWLGKSNASGRLLRQARHLT
eukprot:g44462.t1